MVKLFAESEDELQFPTSLSAIDITSTTAILQWDAVPTAIGYRVRYTPAGTTPWTYEYVTNNHTSISGLMPDTEYAWTVRSVFSQSPASYSDSSAQARFTTTPMRLSEENALEKSFGEVYPNPVQNELTISMSLHTSDITIRVFNLQESLIDLPTTIQDSQAQINTTALPTGFYTLQITNNKTGKSEVSKFVKQQ